METKIKNAFTSLTMPEGCSEKIEAAFRSPARRRPRWQPLAAAACLVLAALVLVQTPVAQAFEQTVETLKSWFYPDAQVTEQYVFEDGMIREERGTTAEGHNYGAGLYMTGRMPTWLDAREEGLYFIGNGEEIDISSLFSEETPFTYEYTDESNIRHIIAVGGTYDPDGTLELNGRFEPTGTAMEQVGWGEWFQKVSESEYGDWIGGYAKGHLDDEGNDRAWFAAAKTAYNTPFA